MFADDVSLLCSHPCKLTVQEAVTRVAEWSTSLISKQWGWRKDQLTKIYLSVTLYGAPAWQPWLSATRLEQLERCQNRALRVITGQLQTTPVETLTREAGVCSMTTLMRRQTAIAYEEAA